MKNDDGKTKTREVTLREFDITHGTPHAVGDAEAYVVERQRGRQRQVCFRFSKTLQARLGWEYGLRVMPSFRGNVIVFRPDPQGWKLHWVACDSSFLQFAITLRPGLPVPRIAVPTPLEVDDLDTARKSVAFVLPAEGQNNPSTLG